MPRYKNNAYTVRVVKLLYRDCKVFTIALPEEANFGNIPWEI